MIYLILRLIFFYILFLFVRSLFRSFFRNKIKSSLGGFDIPGADQRDSYTRSQGSHSRKHKGDDAIEAEFRKL